ncbi:hypothetical protein [Halococcus saccharolyticus]|uniref:Uncharacterized protein n=1 Tax=Halococcus saccharolyticus DSM 5350 TaxID=1227455 RepID=M0MGD6_9EURY|nr:hypothetical protein [Halococcus saccharolyticus]EMA44802.1 hypothetical protein C449_09094 [Halococcus saccharolyticus DSM 5350]
MVDDTPTSEDDGAPNAFVFAAILIAIVALVYVTQPLVTGLFGVDLAGDSTDAPFTNGTPAPTGTAGDTPEESDDSLGRVGTLSPTDGSRTETESTDTRTIADTNGTAAPNATQTGSSTVTTPPTTKFRTPERTTSVESSVTTRTTTATPTTVTTSTTPTATETATATQTTTPQETRTGTAEPPRSTTVSSPTRTSPTPTRTPSPTPEPTTSTTGITTDGQTDRGPAIDTFAVDDRSRNGTTLVTVDWRISDPDSDLTSVRVALVAEPDEGARRVEQQRFDADGDSSLGSTTLELPASVDVYEVRLAAVDENGNSVFALTREVPTIPTNEMKARQNRQPTVRTFAKSEVGR